MTMKNIQKDLAVKIQEEYGLGESNAQSKAAEILDRCPVQLRPNVYEWTEGRLNILVREYRCSGGTDTANPAAGNRCSGTEIPHLIDCLLPASLLA